MIRERDESLNTLLKLFQTEREFVLISFSGGVQRRYKNSKNVQSCKRRGSYVEPEKASKKL